MSRDWTLSLIDLANEFERVNGSQIETAARPYAFIKFGRSSILRFDFLYMINCHVVLLQVLINFLLSYADRYVHSENKEIVSGHENSAKHCKVEWWTLWSSSNNDPKCTGSSWCRWKVRS